MGPGAMFGSIGGVNEHEPSRSPLYMLNLVPVVGTLAPGVESVSREILSAATGPTAAIAIRVAASIARNILLILYPSSR